MKLELSEREQELIVVGLHMLQSDCIGQELHFEYESDLDGTPDPDEVGDLKDKIRGRS